MQADSLPTELSGKPNVSSSSSSSSSVLVLLVTVEVVIYWVFETDHYIEATEDFAFLCLYFYIVYRFTVLFLDSIYKCYCIYLSLSLLPIIFPKSINVAANGNTSFFFMGE